MKIQTLETSDTNSAPEGREIGLPPSGQRAEVPSPLSLTLIPLILLMVWMALISYGYTPDSQSKFFDVISKIVTISATVIGAIWSYYAFFRQRLNEPRLNVAHEVHPLDLPDGRRLLKIYAAITNLGQVRVVLPTWYLRAEQILPLTKTATTDLTRKAFIDAHNQSHWNCLAEGSFSDNQFRMVLEPGETDRASANLVIDNTIEVIQIYSHFRRTKNQNSCEGWPSKTLVDLRKSPTSKGEAS